MQCHCASYRDFVLVFFRFRQVRVVIAVSYSPELMTRSVIGPRDLFADKSFNLARHQANEMAGLMRRHGPFEPHRLPLEEMEYTTMPQVAKKLEGRFVDL